ncbi:putative fucosyltransferase-like protein, partial [Tanacetum coccineum]
KRVQHNNDNQSDVPVGYFSWAEYDIMAPVQPKTEKALAAAFISNCAARNFRLQALEGLEKANVKIDSYGGCHRNRDGNVNKVEALKRYKFSLAFENSDEEDYVTEKFFQSLVAGTIPVVVGPPNIQDFAPAPGSILHIKDLKDIEPVSKTMKYLAANSTAWKYDGPSDSFKALVDMAAVHSSCRLCIFLATRIHEKEEKSSAPNRPCKCKRGSETVYPIYVRERGRFEMESVFLRTEKEKIVAKKKQSTRGIVVSVDAFDVGWTFGEWGSGLDSCVWSGNLTMEALEAAVLLKFKSLKHEPIWKNERPGDDKVLKVYRINISRWYDTEVRFIHF